jgi:carboxypeptidase Q
MLRSAFSFTVALIGIAALLTAQNTSIPIVDTVMTTKIRAEATGASSQVSQIFDTLTIDIGPRLTASPAFFRAVDFAMERLKSWGFDNTHREAWKFGRGWTLDKLTLEMVEPRYAPLIGYAEGWSPSTAGELTATPVYLGNKTAPEIEALKPSLKGAIVMPLPPSGSMCGKTGRSPPLPVSSPPRCSPHRPCSAHPPNRNGSMPWRAPPERA